MPNTPEHAPEYGTPDADSREWTRQTFEKATRFSAFPADLKAFLANDHHAEQTPTQPVSLNVSAEVAKAMERSGPGWQERAEKALRAEFLRQQDAA